MATFISFFFVLNVFYYIGKNVSNWSTVSDRVTFGIFCSFHSSDGGRHSKYSLVSDVANYLYSLWTFALRNYFATESKFNYQELPMEYAHRFYRYVSIFYTNKIKSN